MNTKIMTGDARVHLANIESGSVQTCITSPPYFGLRDYGHDGQIGLEQTPEEYVAELVEVFRLVRDALADDGTLWLNLGDSYAGSGKGGQSEAKRSDGWQPEYANKGATYGLKPKDLIGIPWRVAFALQADGWYLRSDIIWHKPNPMPESVTDRPTKSHEHLFLFSKSPRYYYDHEAIKEPTVDGDHARNKRDVWTINTKPFKGAHFAVMPEALVEPCILAGSRIAGKRCDCDEIIASPTGSGQVEDPSLVTGRAGMNRPRRADEGVRPITRREQRGHAEQIKASPYRDEMKQEAGSAFDHYIRTDRSGARPLPQQLLATWIERGWIGKVWPCSHPKHPADIVLDPFAGSGTVGVVAKRHGRNFIGVELNPEYAAMAEGRILNEPESLLAALEGER